jgi:hypothetical protein
MIEIAFTLSIIFFGAIIFLLLALIGLVYNVHQSLKDLSLIVDENTIQMQNTVTLFNNNFVKFQTDIFERPVKFDTDYYKDNI